MYALPISAQSGLKDLRIKVKGLSEKGGKEKLDKLQSFYYNILHETSYGRRLLDQVN